MQLYLVECLLLHASCLVIWLRLELDFWLVSGYVHVGTLLSVVIVTLPLYTRANSYVIRCANVSIAIAGVYHVAAHCNVPNLCIYLQFIPANRTFSTHQKRRTNIKR